MQKILVCIFVLYHCLSLGNSGKILANHPAVEMADYRFGLGTPYVILYERENYRGKVHFHRIAVSCTNVESKYAKWASSVDLQKRCVTLCEEPDCKGYCRRVLPDQSPKSSKGVARLNEYGLNDKVASVKFCY